MAPKQTSTKKAVAPPRPPALKTTSFTTVAEHLDDTAALLHGLHRRHKNQHRVSTYWWPSFGQLRRAVARLLEDVHNADQKHGIQKITSRVGATRALVPKVYLAFSRLVADKQFAPLGLLLLGVLAQVQSAVHDLERILGITADAADTADTADAANGKTGGSTSNTPPTSASRDTGKQSASRSLPDIDLGVAISRDDGIDDTTAKAVSVSNPKKRARNDDSEEDVPELAAVSAPGTVTHGTKTHAEKKRKTVGDKGHTPKEHESVRETTQTTDKSEKKERKEKDKSKDKSKDKKKKRNRGDEFDDLFSGLL